MVQPGDEGQDHHLPRRTFSRGILADAPLSFLPKDLLRMLEPMWVSHSGHNKAPQTWLTQQNFITSQFWRPEVPRQVPNQVRKTPVSLRRL